jgi:hypothetical protein
MAARHPSRRGVMDLASPGRARPSERQRVDTLLQKVQDKLMPAHAEDIVAINTQTGEYAVGSTFGEACERFHARWPRGPVYLCRVDGGPALHLR